MSPVPHHLRAIAAMLAVATLCLAGCGDQQEPAAVEQTPELGACRMLTPDDVAQPSNTTPTVDCGGPHTAETYAVGDLPADLRDADYDSDELGSWAYRACSERFQDFLGADDSLVMRTVLSWAWFRPTESAWEDGARWYRCDVVGGGEQSKDYVELPKSAKGLLLGLPKDRWMVCAEGVTVDGSVKVPCDETHDWRAVTTISLGEAGDDYPGDRLVEVRTRDFCSSSVGAWLDYPVDYDYGYTWFREAEWEAGNRRSVCWAKTAA